MASLPASTELNDRQQRLLKNVTRSGQALLDIINDILDFAKIEAGKFELSSVPFDPREAIAERADLFSERCTPKGLEFVFFVSEDVPSELIGDPVRLRQILINLVGNAIRFTERGEVTGMCDSLGITTTAEGVETARQFSLLYAEKCTEIQGYLVADPMPARSILMLIQDFDKGIRRELFSDMPRQPLASA